MWIFQTAYKEQDLISFMNPVDLSERAQPDEIQACVEIVRPLNRNVWEYDPDFMSNNDLTIPDADDVEEIKRIQDLFLAQNGKKHLKPQVVEHNAKVFSRENDEKFV